MRLGHVTGSMHAVCGACGERIELTTVLRSRRRWFRPGLVVTLVPDPSPVRRHIEEHHR